MSTNDRDDETGRGGEGAGEQAATVDELEKGLRFLHTMGMQGRLATERAEALLSVVVDELRAAGILDEERVASRLAEARRVVRGRLQKEAHVAVAPARDKYAVEEPDIDCASRIHLCKGRCCRLHFPLSFQDLDEGVIRWNYAAPYNIRQRESDGYCVHNDPETRFCGAYEHRPGVCRSYHCREDPRIWIDFDERIPAPIEAVRDQPLIIERIGIGKPAREGG